MKADLHLHSIHSDGALNCRELADLASRKSLECISLTDHDSVSGQDQIIKEAENRSIRLITGIELSAHYGKKEVHLLGYKIDHMNEDLKRKLSGLSARRKERVEMMVGKLNNLGLNISMIDVEKIKKRYIYGRIHVALALVSKGYVRNTDEAFSKYLKDGKKGFVKKEHFPVDEAIKLIKLAGGKPFIAHPGSSALSNSDIMKLKDYGLMGLEVYHPRHSASKSQDLLKLAREKGLLISGGSDFHGHEKDEIDNLGQKYVNLDISCEETNWIT